MEVTVVVSGFALLVGGHPPNQPPGTRTGPTVQKILSTPNAAPGTDAVATTAYPETGLSGEIVTKKIDGNI